jgi:hypothetical protein
VDKSKLEKRNQKSPIDRDLDSKQLNPFPAKSSQDISRGKVLQPSGSVLQDFKNFNAKNVIAEVDPSNNSQDKKISVGLNNSRDNSQQAIKNSNKKVYERIPPFRTYIQFMFAIYIVLSLAAYGTWRRQVITSGSASVSIATLISYATCLLPVVISLAMMVIKSIKMIKAMLIAAIADYLLAFICLVLVLLSNVSLLGGGLVIVVGAALNFGFIIWTWIMMAQVHLVRSI